MSIYVIADLHLSFSEDKPMDIFGENWNNHVNKIKENWMQEVTDDDIVIIPGDFSWAMHLKDTYKDFEFLNSLPGKKILLKGNHDYWWTTLKSMKNFLNENNFKNIDFLYNNAFCFEDKIIVGTRGWAFQETVNSVKMIKRENERLKLSLDFGIKSYGINKEILVFMHYPPLESKNLLENENLEFYKTMKKYGVQKCFYGHLHGKSHIGAVEGNIDGIEMYLISADYLKFNLKRIE